MPGALRVVVLAASWQWEVVALILQSEVRACRIVSVCLPIHKVHTSTTGVHTAVIVPNNTNCVQGSSKTIPSGFGPLSPANCTPPPKP